MEFSAARSGINTGKPRPEQLADDILKKEQRIAELMAEIKQLL
jgi:hypothetical protein